MVGSSGTSLPQLLRCSPALRTSVWFALAIYRERPARATSVYLFRFVYSTHTLLGTFWTLSLKGFFLCVFVNQRRPAEALNVVLTFFSLFFARCNFSIQESKVRKLEKTRPVSKYNFNVPPKTSVYRACCCYYGALHLFCPRFLCVSRRVDDKKESRNSVGKCPEVQFYRAGCHLKMRRMSWCALTLLCV